MNHLMLSLLVFLLAEEAPPVATHIPDSAIKTGYYQSDRGTDNKLSTTLILYRDSTFHMYQQDFFSTKGSTLGYWSIGTGDSLSLEFENDWLYLEKEAYDSTLYQGWVSAWLLDPRGDSLGMSYLINEGSPSFGSGNRGRIYLKQYIFELIDGQWKVKLSKRSPTPVVIDSLRVYLGDDSYHIPFYTQTFLPSCDTCNAFVIRSKFEHFFWGTKKKEYSLPRYSFFIKNDTIYTESLVGENVVWGGEVK